MTALSGSETLEQAYGLGKLLRAGLGAHSAVLPEATSDALDAFRAPLSAIGDAEIVVVVGDERGRRAGARSSSSGSSRRAANGAEVVGASPSRGARRERSSSSELAALASARS